MSVIVEQSGFQAAMRQHLAITRRSLPEAINARMSYVLMRAYLLTPPQWPMEKRVQVRSYLKQLIEERSRVVMSGKNAGKRKRYGKQRQLRRVHLIVQARRAKAGLRGLYGQEMREAAGKFTNRAVNSVGYLKSLFVRAIRIFSPAFTQFGGRTKKHNGREIVANRALIALAAQYNHSVGGNVGVRRGVKATGRRAVYGFNPVATLNGTAAVDDGQVGRVSAIYNNSMERAFRDERIEMEKHIAAVVMDAAEEAGFKVAA